MIGNVIVEHTHCKDCGCVMYIGKTFSAEGIIDPSGKYCPDCMAKRHNW